MFMIYTKSKRLNKIIKANLTTDVKNAGHQIVPENKLAPIIDVQNSFAKRNKPNET